MTLQLDLAPVDEKPQLRSLLTDCLAELSQYGEVDVDYPYLDLYWTPSERRWPYLIRLCREAVGFVLVNTCSPSGKDADFAMAEFYIVPDARRSGIGRDAAKSVLLTHAGTWELSIMSANAPAQRFWPKVIAAAQASAVERMEGDGEMIYRFRIA